MDINKHRYYMTQVLLAIFQDCELCKLLAFKGGTSLMMFHGLTRFSTDLDFNLLDKEHTEKVYHRIRGILQRFGRIEDEAIKFYGAILVLNYGEGERMLKVEVSTRQYDNHYEVKNLMGTDIRIMTVCDMFAHKLCALGERITPRDVYDTWFFLQNRTEINSNIVRLRTGKSVSEYARQCAEIVKETSPKTLMQGLGEVLSDNTSKNFVKRQLIEETVSLLNLFAHYPLVANQKNTLRMQILLENPDLVPRFESNDVDLSTVSENQLQCALNRGEALELYTRSGRLVKLVLGNV